MRASRIVMAANSSARIAASRSFWSRPGSFVAFGLIGASTLFLQGRGLMQAEPSPSDVEAFSDHSPSVHEADWARRHTNTMQFQSVGIRRRSERN